MALFIKQIMQAGACAAFLVLLASSPVPAEAQARYVDGASTCVGRTGDRDCSFLLGPFRKIGEGVKAVPPGGTLFVRGGSYTEPILLNKAMQIQAYDGAATIIGPSPLAPFDLMTDTGGKTHWWVDDNLLPLNPKWAGQLIGPNSLPDPHQGCPDHCQCPVKARTCIYPKCFWQDKHYWDTGILPCSNQFTYQNNTFYCGPHLNWFGATYSGTIFWESKSCGWPDDDDYNMNLTPDDNAGLATTRDKLHAEFDYKETINHFSSGWWSRFHKAVDDDGVCGDAPPGPKATDMIGEFGSRAIVTALMGFDTEHDTFVELHPVWALAMNVEPRSSHDFWVLFVRNWGKEGNCGGNQEFIDFPNNQYTFRLPWRAGATSVTVISNFDGYHTQSPTPSEENGTVRIAPGVGIFVTFALDAPRDDGSIWYGELQLQWTGLN
jgi:hypothetical protein